MAHITLNYFSEILGMQTEMSVIIPQQFTGGEIGVDRSEAAGKYKCLYLLHGLSDDHTIWMRRTSIERYASKYGICVVMPRADKSFYSNMKHGDDYYTHIAREVPKIVHEFFNVSDKREDNFIAGLSMGGYGALKIGLREKGKFAAAAGISPCTDIKTIGFEGVLSPIFGEDINVPDEDDLLWLADNCKDDEMRPRLYMGIGTNDFLYQNNFKFREKMAEHGYDFTYRESEGVHNWDFWDEYIQYVLTWMFGY